MSDAIKAKQHELLVELKDLAIQLGKTPSTPECEAHRGGLALALARAFGSYNMAVTAAGLEPNRKTRTKFMSADLSAHLEGYTPPARPSPEMTPKFTGSCLILGDFHAPFQHKKAVAWAIEMIARLKPTRIVQAGDLFDMFSWSKFPTSRNHFTPQQEAQLGREAAEKLWADARKAAPKAECFQLMGNHDVRPMKRVLEAAPALEVFLNFRPYFEFDGVKLIQDPREELAIDGVYFIHGHRTRLGAHRDYLLAPTVVGHTHKGGVVYRNVRGRTIWELNVGFLADAQSKGLSYTSQKIDDCTLGIGWIDELGPRFIPYQP